MPVKTQSQIPQLAGFRTFRLHAELHERGIQYGSLSCVWGTEGAQQKHVHEDQLVPQRLWRRSECKHSSAERQVWYRPASSSKYPL
jgi:hypothetical protein